MSQKTEQDHAAMIADEDRWPCWPRLPVKRYTDNSAWPEIGVVIAGEKTTVRLATLFDDKATLLAATTKVYPSIDAMLIDGWIVD